MDASFRENEGVREAHSKSRAVAGGQSGSNSDTLSWVPQPGGLPLIFVGVQVHQAAAASRSATVLQLKDNWVQLNLAGATNPELIDAYDTVIARGLESDARARGLVDAFERARLHNWSNAYYQYRNGTLEEDQWLPHLREIQHNVGNPILKKVWSEWDYAFDEEFRKLMDDTLGTRAG